MVEQGLHTAHVASSILASTTKIRGMGLLGVVACFASRISEGFDPLILHQDMLITLKRELGTITDPTYNK